MKTRLWIITVIAVLLPFSFAYGRVMPMTTQEVLDEFDLIFQSVCGYHQY